MKGWVLTPPEVSEAVSLPIGAYVGLSGLWISEVDVFGESRRCKLFGFWVSAGQAVSSCGLLCANSRLLAAFLQCECDGICIVKLFQLTRYCGDFGVEFRCCFSLLALKVL